MRTQGILFSTAQQIALPQSPPTGNRPAVAALAQLVEHRIRNAGVTCSSHVSGTIYPFANSRERLKNPQKSAKNSAGFTVSVRLRSSTIGRFWGPLWGPLRIGKKAWPPNGTNEHRNPQRKAQG